MFPPSFRVSRRPSGAHNAMQSYSVDRRASDQSQKNGPGAPNMLQTQERSDTQVPPSAAPRCRGRRRLVARRRHLPGLSAQLRRHQRRRHRRPRRRAREARLHREPRRRRDLALAVLQVADEGLRLRRQRVPAGRPDLRHARGLRPPGRGGARARAAHHHRPGAEPHVRPARLVPGEPRQPRQPQGGLVRVGRSQTGRHAAQQLALDLRRLRLAMGAAPRPVLPAQLPGQPAGPQLPQPGRRRADARGSGVLAGARRGRIPPRCDQLLLPRSAPARQPAEARGRAQGPRFPRSTIPTPTRCTSTTTRSRRTTLSSSRCAG